MAMLVALAIVISAAASGDGTAPRTPHDPGAADRRRTLHEILDRATDENDGIHDACGELLHVGDESSVPHLIRALRFFGDGELPLPPGVGLVCTQSHCVDALEHITGAKVGISYSSWRAWWETTHPGQSLEGPPGRAGHPLHERAHRTADRSPLPPSVTSFLR